MAKTERRRGGRGLSKIGRQKERKGGKVMERGREGEGGRDRRKESETMCLSTASGSLTVGL